MPNRNGIEATKMIKAINKKIPIIAQTAFFLEQDKINIIEAGCDDLLKKPISQLKLKQTISKYLNQY